jgi:hypothetical protein
MRVYFLERMMLAGLGTALPGALSPRSASDDKRLQLLSRAGAVSFGHSLNGFVPQLWGFSERLQNA